jgi:hypothetical protein
MKLVKVSIFFYISRWLNRLLRIVYVGDEMRKKLHQLEKISTDGKKEFLFGKDKLINFLEKLKLNYQRKLSLQN